MLYFSCKFFLNCYSSSVQKEIFHFDNFEYQEDKKQLLLRYSCAEYKFTERINFPKTDFVSSVSDELLNKAFTSAELDIGDIKLSKNEADFFYSFCVKGLGEFSYRNNISLKDAIKFPYDEKQRISLQEEDINLPETCAVLIGGGKDSIVSNTSNIPRPIKDTFETAELPSLITERKIDPIFFEPDFSKKVLNGHIPITGIIAFITLATGMLCGFKYAVLSNERSANEGNTEFDGMIVNHQWSKSFELEQAFSKLISENITKEFKYFSFLRPLSEIKIIELFSRFEKYHPIFTSCNHTFKFNEKNRIDRWCSNCDKCRFVFLMLAPFLSKQKLENIFGKDLLDDETQGDGYRELLGLKNIKPFECVGEIEESLLAFLMLMQKDDFKNDTIIKLLKDEVLEKHKDVSAEELMNRYMKPADKYLLPAKFKEILYAAL